MAERGPGQPTIMTDDIVLELCDYLASGHYRGPACKMVGISYSAFHNWLKAEGPQYDALRKAVDKAEATAEHLQLRKITQSERTEDAKWYLARKHPDRWAETKRVDISGRLDMGIKLNAQALADADAREHIDGLVSWLFTQTPESEQEPDPDEQSAAGDTEP